MAEAIAVENLTRTFGAITAVDDITFSVEAGEVFGVLGPNGAGKTTLIRLMNGILTPTAGSARLFGKDAAAEGAQVRGMCGVLTETPSHYERLTARRNLAFYATVYGIPEGEVRERIERSLQAFGLQDRGDDRVGGFSTGMKQRLALARALIHEPPLLFLDEPTSGLDPEAARQVDAMIAELARSEGRTVFLSTHNLHEAEALCDRVALLNRGRILAVGTIRELTQRIWQVQPLDIELLSPPPPAVAEALAGIDGVTVLSRGDTAISLQVDRRETIPEVVASIVRNGGAILQAKSREYSLEEIYFEIQQRGRSG